MCNQREMTLQEWVDELPEFHLAHKEYDTLRTQRDRAVELLRRGLRATDIDSCAQWECDIRALLAEIDKERNES